MTGKRLIEVGFPLEAVSLDSAHEKNVRHGHLSTLHIWPARRPLAACRAALIGALLPDPGSERKRRDLHARMAGAVMTDRRDEVSGGRRVSAPKRVTVGGILHWGREADEGIEQFRADIRRAFGGRAPRVLDPFAGGGAIPLEAMRLGCEVEAADINPVAWFLLRCALEYPQRLAGKTRPLPRFARSDREFMGEYWKSRGYRRGEIASRLDAMEAEGTADSRGEARRMFPLEEAVDGNLAWQVRAWSRRVLTGARKRLASRYPVYAEFVPLRRGDRPYEEREPHCLAPDAEGGVTVDTLNEGLDGRYLADRENPRWVAKPAAAYLWARTVECKRCRAELPLLKTRWLCRRPGKRVLLTMAPNADRTGVVFGVEEGGETASAKAAGTGEGTTSRTGARCPCCSNIMAMEDLRIEGRAGRMGAVMTAVVVDGPSGKEYRRPRAEEIQAATVEDTELAALYEDIPFGLPDEPTPSKESLGVNIPLYGFDTWRTVFGSRQLLALGAFVREVRACRGELADHPRWWREAISAYLSCVVSKLADYSSALCSWDNGRETLRDTFARFAFPMVWDYCEVNPLATGTGGFSRMAEWVSRYLQHADSATAEAGRPKIQARSALSAPSGQFDLICTDPPYYDAIPYSDLMDFFHVWLRRALHGLSPEMDEAFKPALGPKWSEPSGDGELIDESARFGGDRERSRKTYEDGMERAFSRCRDALGDEGRLVVVFANKQPDAWETLVAALIRSGFVVTGSWPIRTEMQTRQRSLGSAALSSSVWLVCRKRPPKAAPGWDKKVLSEMRESIRTRLRVFWDAGLRGPDFVWAATGPALEAFSRHPVVKRVAARRAGASATLGVAEFLREVRRMVVDFVVRRVLTTDASGDESGGESGRAGARGRSSSGGETNEGAVAGLDDVTTYYLLHRQDYGLESVPAGASILYAQSCGIPDRDLSGTLDLLETGKGKGSGRGDETADEGEAGGPEAGGTEGAGAGGTVRLKAWNRRALKPLREERADDRPTPLIDHAHCLMGLWSAGVEAKVNEYLRSRGLLRNSLFPRVLQALVELAPAESEERRLLESVTQQVAAKAGGAVNPDLGVV